MSKAESYENPLVPNRKLLQIYGLMADVRAIDEHIAVLQKKVKTTRKLDSIRGQEAARVSTALELKPGDLVSDSQLNLATDLISGTQSKAHINSMLTRVTEFHEGKIDDAKLHVESALARTLPWVQDAGQGLRMAMGAALAFKTLQRGSVVISYVTAEELRKKEWREIVELSARLELPIIFVVSHRNTKGNVVSSHLSSKVRSWGMPGIPVDSTDAVALYRVTQESLGRIRGGGGPVFIECLSYRLKGNGVKGAADPLVQMQEFMLSRKVCTESWLERARERLKTRLSTSER